MRFEAYIVKPCNQCKKCGQRIYFLCSGNHTFASIRGSESYELLKNAFKNVIAEINQVISDGSVMVEEKRYTLNFVLGGDYKVFHQSTSACYNTCNTIGGWCMYIDPR